MTEQPDEQPAHPRAGEVERKPKVPLNELFAWAYAVAASVGISAVFLSPDLWPIPSASIVIYYLFGHRKAQKGGTIFEFADSVYYLGFTLSIGSLLASLDPFSLRGKPNPEKIFHYFGLGLLTTLIGIVLRTVVQQFYRLPSESIEAANRRVGEETNAFVVELKSLRFQVIAHTEAAVKTYSEQLLPRLNELVGQAASVANRFESAANIAIVIEKNSTRVAGAIDTLGNAYDGATKKIDAEHVQWINAYRVLAAQLVQASQAIEQASRAAAGGLNEVRVSAGGSAAGLGNLVQSLRPVSEATDELRHALAAVTRGISEASTALHDGIGGLKEQASVLRGTAGSIRRSSAAIEQTNLGSRLAELSSQVEHLATSIGEQQRLTAEETGILKEAVGSALVACQGLHQAVQEIAMALATRLETVP